MKQKIFVLIMMLLMCLCAILIIPSEYDVEATGGGGGGESGDIGLDYDFMWNVTEELSDVINRYPPGMIPKGRAFGTYGEIIAGRKIKELMENLSLENIDKIQLGPIQKQKYLLWEYSSKVETEDFKLTVNHPDFPFTPDIPISELFVYPSAAKNNSNINPLCWTMNYNNTFDNTRL